MSGLDELLGRVRAALGRRPGEPAPPPPALDEGLLRLVLPDADLVPLFERRAAAVGAEVSRTGRAALAAHVEGLARALGLRRVTAGLEGGPLGEAARRGLVAAGVEVLDHRARPGMAAHFDADAGVTDALAAVAETGSVVMATDAAHPRGAYLAPPVHVVLVEARRIVADLVDLWPAGAGGGAMPSALAVVTGPSKTADIEGILVRGVHGPGRVVVVVVE